MLFTVGLYNNSPKDFNFSVLSGVVVEVESGVVASGGTHHAAFVVRTLSILSFSGDMRSRSSAPPLNRFYT
jgi:hypothetical protein